MATSRIDWVEHRALALGKAFVQGKDIGYRTDLIILVEEGQEKRALELNAEAAASGHRAALMMLDGPTLSDVKWPPGVPVFLIPPEEKDRTAFENKARALLITKRLYVIWAEGPDNGARRKIGFNSLAEDILEGG